MMKHLTSSFNTAQATIFDAAFSEITIGDLTAVVSRYAPEMNSAVYELFARFNLQTGPAGQMVVQVNAGAST